jgi:K+-transporting ATPase ATPase C chain
MKNSVWIGIRVFLVAFIVLGIAYPLLVTGVATVAMPAQARGSLVRSADGAVVGSALLGQVFDAPGYFHSRPSASDYDPLRSGGTNLGPTSRLLAERVGSDARAMRSGTSVPTGGLPSDAITASGSGLDPDISPANALSQVPRVASARGVDAAEVRRMVEDAIVGRDLGFIGEPRVNVLRLNLALDRSFSR